MEKTVLVKPVINKANGQLNFSLSKKKVPKKVLDILKKDPSAKPIFKMKVEWLK